MLTILILTQNERLYLPDTIAGICRQLEGSVVCVASLSPMRTHHGWLRGMIKHLILFGFLGVLRLASKNVLAAIKSKTRRPGRGGPFNSVRNVAMVYSIPYYPLSKINDTHSLIDKYNPDILVSISCPVIIGKRIRERFPMGCINVHGGPLPRYRGLMPAFWVLRNNEPTTAVTVHELGDKLDDGDILVQRKVAISKDETWESLVKKTKSIACEAAVEALQGIVSGCLERSPNRESESSYYGFPRWRDRKAFLAAGRHFF